MAKIFKVSFYSYLVFTAILNLAYLKGLLSFGHGFGDLYFLIFSIVILFIAAIIFSINKTNSNKNLTGECLGISLILIAALILILKSTILKGPE